ncbi:SusC/RagA family TonB-linked outer membrane protein [Pedobacter miscanthi]|uniref:SusC/RagA family TonB-linked outer membrane protein n=2 Tax=Pedobacter miscanthi TaxID=2259170 RepID=A0A366KMP8_9SPHI|nr:SusC/RagA family TonB-linked outer membrane protein [Pedobacter miscanthi]
MNFYAFTKGMARPCPDSKVLIKTMKLLIILSTAFLMQVSASTFGQKINLNVRDIPFKTALETIAEQAGVNVVYPDALLGNTKNVRVSFKGLSLTEALDRILEGQPNLAYELKDKTIVLKKSASTYIDKVKNLADALFTADIDARGKVVDSLGLGIPGATVKIIGKPKIVYTNSGGDFIIPGLKGGEMLEISYVGYTTVVLPAKADLGIIRLKASIGKLDEVTVMSYSQTTRRLSTGSTGKVTGDEITKQPVSNAVIALQGRVPGLFITQSAGYAGGNVSVTIRGQNSLTLNSSAPLYIVDGVPFGSGPVEKSIGAFSPQSDFSPLNTINPAEIDNVVVLKDADATAIYGSRGANGVILITTKKGRPGRTNVTADFSQGFGEASNLVKMLGTEEYLNIRRQAFANDNITPTAANAPDLVLFDQNAFTNFPQLLIGNTSKQTNAGLAISGGDAFTQFTLGGTFRRESTVYYDRSDDKATQLRLSLQHKSRNSKFATTATVSYNSDNNQIPIYNMNLTNYGLPPNYPLYTPTGALYWGPGYTNPLAAFNTYNNLKSTNLNAAATLRYTILPGLDIKANGGYNLIDVKGNMVTPVSATNPSFNSLPQITSNNNYIRTYIAEPQVTYGFDTGKGKLNLIAGGTWQQVETVQPFWILGNYTNPQLATSLNQVNILAKNSDYADFRYTSVYGRAEYNLNNKYLVSANIRRDGSTKFGANNRFGNFGSAALGWIFSKEKLISDNLKWLSYGKLRASYGTVGNDKIRDYEYQSNYSGSSTYGPSTTLTPARVANPYLKWEETKKLDIALEMGFLKDRILFTAAYYRNRSTNLLQSVPLAAQTGFSQYTSNFDATVQNRGLELELNTINIEKGGFRWTSSFNITFPENKLVSYPGLLTSTNNNTYVVGQSLNLRTVYQSTGIVNGIATVADLNGDGVITGGIFENGKGDQHVYGNNDPKYYGGFNNTFTYKGFELDIFLTGISRTATRGDLNFGTYPGFGYNLPVTLADVGLKYSTNTASAAGSKYNLFTGSDTAVESASFIRLRNVSLSYSVPASFSKKIGMSSLQVYVRGQNLITFTNYKGLDPETLTTQIPPLKMFTTGIRATF